jgi:WD40 repeat protein
MKLNTLHSTRGMIKCAFASLFLLISSVSFAQKTELVVPAKHSKAVISAIYSGDGQKIISIGSDQALKIWSAKSGLLLSTIKDTLVKYEALSLLPTKSLVFIRTDKGYQLLDCKKNQITVSKRIPKYSGGSLVEGSSDFYYAKGFEGAPGEKARYKLFKRNVSSNTDEEPLTEFNDPEGRIAWPLSFYQGGQTIRIKLFQSHTYFYRIKNNAVSEFNNVKYVKETADGIIDLNYLLSEMGNLIEISNYRGKKDYTVKYTDGSTNAVKKSFELKNVSNYTATPKGLFYTTDKSAGIYDEKADKVIQVTVPAAQRVLTFDDLQNKFLVVDDQSGINISIADASKGKTELALGGKTLFTSGVLENDRAYKQFWLASGNTRKYLNVTDGRILLTSAQSKIPTSETVYPDFEKSLVRELMGDSILTYKFSKKEIALSNVYNLKEIIRKEFSTKKPHAFCISDDGGLVALGNSQKTIIYNLLQKRVVNTYSILGTINQFCFSANNDYLFIGVKLAESSSDDSNRLICYKTIGTPAPIWEKKHWNVQKMAIEKSDPKKLRVVVSAGFNDADRNMQGYEGYYELNTANGNTLDYTRGPIMFDYGNVKIMPDVKTAMYAIGKYLLAIDKSSGVKTVAETYSEPAGATNSYGNFYNNEFLIFPVAAGSYAIFDLKRGVTVADLYLFDGSNDWILLTKDGRFDGTKSATRALYYIRNDAKIEVDAVYEKFYTPNLLMRLLSRENLPPLDIKLEDLRPKPTAKLQYAEAKRNLEVDDSVPVYANASGKAEISVHAIAPDDKVDEIRLFHNGKAVNLTTRGLLVTDADGFDSKKYTIDLLPGTNNFSAIALNSQRTESEPDEIVVNYKKDGTIATPPKPRIDQNGIVDQIDRNATLHIVVVGINAYKNKINPLTYAIPDAKAFKAELEQDAKSIVGEIKSYLVADDQASKAGILAAFETIKSSAKPEDVFVFYYAGHGYIHPSNNEFYLVSADVGDSGESLLKNGISAKVLQALAVQIPAQKQLFIMDACQSAGAFEKMQQHDGEQQKSLSVIARSTGTHWMAASGSTETAKEFGQLGHGVFTYSLLEALKGKAASNKMITVNGLKYYLQEIVPELVKKYGSSGQYPASYGSGNDFPLEVVNK